MLLVLSPAKTLDETPVFPAVVKLTAPAFYEDAEMLATQLATLNDKKLAALMDISPKLAALNTARFAHFTKGSYPAAWMFRGDVYDGLDIDTLPDDALPGLQARLRMLSGLYGLLRPSDRMHPYRLEMGTKLKTARGADLYDFWGERISIALNKAAKAADTDVLLNLASVEYSSAIDRDALKPRMLHVHFKQRKGNKLQVISLFAKRARGTMARWIVEHGAQEKDLRTFAEDGYRFEAELSDPEHLVFARS